jgi:FkbM family methyltransferase
MLEQALCLLPNRPEAYFLLSRFAEKRQWWQDCYIHSKHALDNCDFDCKPLRTDVEYPGKYGLLFERAISAWWWGKSDESKNLFTQILTEYDNVNPFYVESVKNNLKLFGDQLPEEPKEVVHEVLVKDEKEDFRFKEDFDWSELTYEDIITIDREIIHEQVYRYWRDVHENDIVMDIGSSVGPFICSILENKPSKVYCVEPSKTLIKTLAKNCAEYVLDYPQNPLTYINYGIVNEPGDSINIFGSNSEFNGITFKDLIKSYSIDKINFLKIDCEGGEYNIFKEENMQFLLNRVEFIAMEVHLNYENCRKKFKEFRDKYLVQFKDYRVMSCTRQQISWGNSIDIKDRLFDDKFIDEYTCEFMIYIHNHDQ